MLKLSIPKPCHEDWNKMTPNEQGSYCNVCSKTVVDFTLLSDDEVKNYFIQHRGQKTCGRFNNSQLADTVQPVESLSLQHLPLWKKFLAALVICFSSFLTGCSDQLKGKIDTGQIKIIPVNTDTSVFNPSVPDTTGKCTNMVGEIKIIPQDIPITGAVYIEPVVKGEVEPYQLVGDVDVVDYPSEQPKIPLQPVPLPDSTKVNEKECGKGVRDTLYYNPG